MLDDSSRTSRSKTTADLKTEPGRRLQKEEAKLAKRRAMLDAKLAKAAEQSENSLPRQALRSRTDVYHRMDQETKAASISRSEPIRNLRDSGTSDPAWRGRAARSSINSVVLQSLKSKGEQPPLKYRLVPEMDFPGCLSILTLPDLGDFAAWLTPVGGVMIVTAQLVDL